MISRLITARSHLRAGMSFDGDASTAGEQKPRFADSTSRWLVLFTYCIITSNQSLFWMTWSSVPDKSKEYLNVSDDTLDLWLTWGPTAFLVTVFAASYLLSQYRHGLQYSIRIAAVMCFTAAVVRCLPILFSDDDIRGQDNDMLVAVVHACQFLNGAAAPFVVATPSALSLTWFPEHQRNAATAVANTANALGRGIGFFLGPAIVKQGADLPTLLLIEIGLALLPVVLCFTVVPAQPHVPPSAAAVAEAKHWDAVEAAQLAKVLADERGEGAGAILLANAGVATDEPKAEQLSNKVMGLSQEVWAALRTPSFVLLCVAGGLEMAVYGAWSGVLPSVLTLNSLYTDTQAGAFGSVNTFAGIGGGILAGLITDRPALRKELVPVVVALLLLSTICFALISAALPHFQSSDLTPLASNYGGLLSLCALAGLLRGGTDPLFFELTAETVANSGVSAGTAGGVLTFWYHLILCCFLGIPSSILLVSAMPAMAVCLGIAAVLLMPVKVSYVRRA